MRLECVRLLAQGRIAPEIATIVDRHVATVRAALHRFFDGGFDALADAPRASPARHGPPASPRTSAPSLRKSRTPSGSLCEAQGHRPRRTGARTGLLTLNHRAYGRR
ncbi:helix-turn-helix domain-containing protein [Streptomyces mirabilis]|uniref:helix-turn-helix domain-containing protein n=1 Tax=Streptomyces mirabilis TaxID=68239 RepID=UPI00368CE728